MSKKVSGTPPPSDENHIQEEIHKTGEFLGRQVTIRLQNQPNLDQLSTTAERVADESKVFRRIGEHREKPAEKKSRLFSTLSSKAAAAGSKLAAAGSTIVTSVSNVAHSVLHTVRGSSPDSEISDDWEAVDEAEGAEEYEGAVRPSIADKLITAAENLFTYVATPPPIELSPKVKEGLAAIENVPHEVINDRYKQSAKEGECLGTCHSVADRLLGKEGINHHDFQAIDEIDVTLTHKKNELLSFINKVTESDYNNELKKVLKQPRFGTKKTPEQIVQARELLKQQFTNVPGFSKYEGLINEKHQPKLLEAFENVEADQRKLEALKKDINFIKGKDKTILGEDKLDSINKKRGNHALVITKLRTKGANEGHAILLDFEGRDGKGPGFYDPNTSKWVRLKKDASAKQMYEKFESYVSEFYKEEGYADGELLIEVVT